MEAHEVQDVAGDGRVKPGFPDHPKVAHLADRLGIPEAHALGVLIRLWDRVATTCDNGILRGWTARDFARQIAWAGDAGALLDALHGERWLDLSGVVAECYLIHDWPEEAPRHVALKWVRAFDLRGDGVEARARSQMRAMHDLELGRASNDRSAITSVLIGSDRGCTDRIGSDPVPSARAPRGKASVHETSKADASTIDAPSTGKRKPITEHAGLLGDLARAYLIDRGEAPTWGKAEAVGVARFAKEHGLGAAEILPAYQRLLADPFEGFASGSPLLLVKHFDRFRTAAKPRQPKAPERRRYMTNEEKEAAYAKIEAAKLAAGGA